MNELELKALTEKVGAEAASEISKKAAEIKEGFKTELEALKAANGGEKADKSAFDALAKKHDEAMAIITAQAETLQKMKEQATPSTKSVSMATALVDGFKSLSASGKIADLKKGQWESIEVKSATTISTSNIDGVGTNSIPYNLASYEPGITGIVRRNPFIAQLMNSGNINKPYAQWTEMVLGEGGAGMTAEGSDKSQYDFDLQEASAKVKKITAYTKVTKEMLDDVAFIEAEIRNELITIIALKMDEQLLSGDDTSENMKGILEYATDFAAGNFANTVKLAKEADVLRVAIQQVNAANFDANYIVLNGEDVTKMELAKDSTGQYVLPPFTSANGMTVKGIPVVANNGVTAGTFLVGDFTKSNLRTREGITLSVGLDGNDFTKNLVTILAETRAVHFVKSQHTTAFVTGTFSTAIEAIEAVA